MFDNGGAEFEDGIAAESLNRNMGRSESGEGERKKRVGERH